MSYETKKDLLESWICSFENRFSIRLLSKRESIDREVIIERLNDWILDFPKEDTIYLIIQKTLTHSFSLSVP